MTASLRTAYCRSRGGGCAGRRLISFLASGRLPAIACSPVRRIPISYTPMFYKSLERAPRKSGLLTPNFGTSSKRGTMIGGGYYWAINRSYDATYRAQLFTQRVSRTTWISAASRRRTRILTSFCTG